jgi:hypothetical protein
MRRSGCAVMADAEIVLRRSRRPLVIGMGGGGDVVGALATAEAMRLYDGPVDPRPGPRAESEITGGWALAPGVLLAGPRTRVRGRDIRFAESRMAEFIGRPTLLVDVNPGAAAVAEGLAAACRALDRDLVIMLDVGGDVLAQGDEPGLRSPLCDALMLAAAGKLRASGHEVLLGVFGVGCDSELTHDEVLERVSRVAQAGGVGGVRGLTEPVAARVQASLQFVPTEASAQALRAYRGVHGPVFIRDGTRSFELTSLAAQTWFLDVAVTIETVGRLARALADAPGLEQANEALHELGVRTELDLERDAASRQARDAKAPR